MQKAGIPKGTRDFSPAEMIRRKFIFHTIEQVFKLFGFQPLETPSMELLSTLTGKYGAEGDQLLFKILDSGDFLKGVPTEVLEQGYKKLTPHISEKGLRYDLTVPFARYLSMHRNDIQLPFKRYQIQPVWRGDRPQFGRYREFYQCDADIAGSDSLLNEVELIALFDEVFARLGLAVTLKLNNRKILQGIAECTGTTTLFFELIGILDQREKITAEAFRNQLQTLGLSPEHVKALETMDFTVFESNAQFQEGKQEIAYIQSFFGNDAGMTRLKSLQMELDLGLARGLDYYTGCIFEVKARGLLNGSATSSFSGSIAAGGRYDNLTGIFGLPGISGTGISFGADRIYDVLTELNGFPDLSGQSTKVLICPMDENLLPAAWTYLMQIREHGICAEIYPEAAKMKKQLSYAANRGIPFVLILGENEINTGLFSLKNMVSGTQQNLPLSAVIEELKS